MLDVILREGQAGNDIALYPGARPTVDIWMTTLPDVTLAPARREVSRWVQDEGPPSEYFGELVKWTGSAWNKAKLLYYTGSAWVQAKLKKWNGTEWKEFNVTGQ